MATYTGSDKRLGYLFTNGGGGGGSSTLAGLSDVYLTSPSDGQILKYDATNQEWINANESGGGTGGGSFACDLLLENADFSIASGSGTVERQYTLSASIENYDGVLVVGFTNVNANERNQAVSMIVLKASYNIGSSVRWTYLLNGSITNNNRRLAFGFSDSTTIQTAATRPQYEEPRLYRVYGLNFGGTAHTYSATEQVVGTWVDGKPIYEKTISFTNQTSSFSDFVTIEYISDVGTVISMDWTAYRISNDAYYTGNGGAVTESASYNTYRILFRFSKAIAALQYFIGGYGTDISDISVIMRYTKSTDMGGA